MAKKLEKVAVIVTATPSAPADGPHIILEAEAPTRAEAAAQALDMASQGPYPFIFALNDEGDIPTFSPQA